MRKICLLFLIMFLVTGWAQAEEFDPVKELEAQIAQGDADAMGSLGLMYIRGEEIPQDVPKGLELLHAGVENGSHRAAGRLGMLYYRGQYVKRDYAKAYEYLARGAEGWGIARNVMSWLYYDGQPVMVFAEVKAAAEAGDTEAQYDLGQLYQSPLEGEVNLDEAVKWYTKAAEKGYLKAQLALSFIHQGMWSSDDPEDKYTDPEKQIYWLEKAAAQGNVDAMWTLAGVYSRDNRGIKPDFARAREWYLKAAQNGNTWAYEQLAYFYYKGELTQQDYAEALRLYLLAAEGGNSSAMGTVADMYAEGLGTEPDAAEARRWRLKEAYAMVPFAQDQLGDIYYKGDENVKFNEKQAKSWREMALDEPGLGAVHMLANYYEQKVPVKKDMDEALRWYKLAAQNGHLNTALQLGRMYGMEADYYGLKRDDAEAAKWYALGAEKGDMYAQYALALMYIRGEGVPRDLVQAYVLMAKAYVNDTYDSLEANVMKYVLRKALPAEMSPAEISRAQKLLEAEGISTHQYLKPE